MELFLEVLHVYIINVARFLVIIVTISSGNSNTES